MESVGLVFSCCLPKHSLASASASGLPMSTTNQATGPSQSSDNFAAIFQAALSDYETVTGQPLRNHSFATQLESCDSPQAISDVLRTQAENFSKFHRSDEKLMAFLDPTVHILFTFSATLGEGVGLVSHWFSPYFRLLTFGPAIFTRENNIHGDGCTSRGWSLPQVPCHAYV